MITVSIRIYYHQTDEYGPILSTFNSSGLEQPDSDYYRLLIMVNESTEESCLIEHKVFYPLMERFSLARAGDQLLEGEQVSLSLHPQDCSDFIEGLLKYSCPTQESIASISRFEGNCLLIIGAVADDGGGEISAILRIAEAYLKQHVLDRVNVVLLSSERKKKSSVILQAEQVLQRRCHRVYSMIGDDIDYYGLMSGPGKISLPADRKQMIKLLHDSSFVINASPWIGDLSIPCQSGMVRLRNKWVTPKLCLTDLGGGGARFGYPVLVGEEIGSSLANLPVNTCRSGLNSLVGELGIQLIQWQQAQQEALNLFAADIKTEFVIWLNKYHSNQADYIKHHRPVFFYNRAEERSEEEDFTDPGICHQEKKLLVNTLILTLLQNKLGVVNRQGYKTIDFIIADGLKKIYGKNEFGFKTIADSLKECSLFSSVVLDGSNLHLIYQDGLSCLCRLYIKRLQQVEMYGLLELGLQSCQDVGCSFATGCGAGSMTELFSRKHEQVIAVTLGDGTYNYQRDSLTDFRRLFGCTWLMNLQGKTVAELIKLSVHFHDSETFKVLRQLEQWVYSAMNITGLLTTRISKEIRGESIEWLEAVKLGDNIRRPIFYLDLVRRILEKNPDEVIYLYELLDRVFADLDHVIDSAKLLRMKTLSDEELTAIFDCVFYAGRSSIVQTFNERLAKQPLLPMMHPVVLVLCKTFNLVFASLQQHGLRKITGYINSDYPSKRSKAEIKINNTV